jgi:hypothetical protein
MIFVLFWHDMSYVGQWSYEIYCDAFDESMVGENENVKGIKREFLLLWMKGKC